MGAPVPHSSGGVAQPAVPAGTQDARRMLGIGAAGDGRHGAVEGAALVARVRSRRAEAHLVGAGADEERIATGMRGVPRAAGRGRMIPGAGLRLPAAGVGSVGEAGALRRCRRRRGGRSRPSHQAGPPQQGAAEAMSDRLSVRPRGSRSGWQLGRGRLRHAGGAAGGQNQDEDCDGCHNPAVRSYRQHDSSVGSSLGESDPERGEWRIGSQVSGIVPGRRLLQRYRLPQSV